jgi:general stress protein YciG
MPWAKVDDCWWAHPKVMAADLAARGLWITVLSWSCAQRRDMVPETLVLMVTGGSKTEANALVDAGLWHEVDGGWRIHDWADYQERSLSEKRAEAGRKGGQRSRPPDAKGKQAVVASEADGEAGPNPTQPGPSQPDAQLLPSQSEIAILRPQPVDDPIYGCVAMLSEQGSVPLGASQDAHQVEAS